jgi:hypothetical protein
MLLPANFTKAVADTFYDKTVKILEKVTTETDGWVDESGTTVKSIFQANVRFSKLGEVQNELGLSESIDIAITCSTEVDVKTDTLISYNDVTYNVTAVLPNDSHKKIAGRKWA